MCRIAGVSRAAYYKWRKRTPTVEEKQNEAMMVLVRDVQTRVRGIYGYRWMAQHLSRELGYPINRKRLSRLMKIYDLQAVIRRKKKRSPGAQPMVHSDRGFQYTSRGFKAIVEAHGLDHSMSRVSRCLDNGPMEGFFGTLKCEEYYLPDSFYATYEGLAGVIHRYIGSYNHQRYQEYLSGLIPVFQRDQAA